MFDDFESDGEVSSGVHRFIEFLDRKTVNADFVISYLKSSFLSKSQILTIIEHINPSTYTLQQCQEIINIISIPLFTKYSQLMQKEATSKQTPIKFNEEAARACKNNDYATIHMLLSTRRVDIREVGCDGTPILNQAASSGNNEEVKYLIEQGADIESPNRSGQTTLIMAALTRVIFIKFVDFRSGHLLMMLLKLLVLNCNYSYRFSS